MQKLTSEIFVRAWDKFKTDGSEPKVKNWAAFLYQIAHNLIVNYYKKKKSVSLDELQEQGFDPASPEEEKSDVFEPERIAKYLSGIDPESRELLVMRYVDDMGPSEIAAVTGLSENVISVRLHRGVKKLRTLLGDE